MLSMRRREQTSSRGRRGDSARGRHERLPSIDDIDDDTTDNNVHINMNIAASAAGEASSSPSSPSALRGDIEAGVFETNPSIPDETTELTFEQVTHPHTNTGTAATASASASASRAESNSSTVDSTVTATSSSAGAGDATGITRTEDENGPPDTDILRSRLQMQLQYLKDQSDVHKNSTKTWTVIIGLILFRIWLESLISADIGLTSISLVCTSYFLRWIQYRHMQVQRFDERIEYLTQLLNNEESSENFSQDSEHDVESNNHNNNTSNDDNDEEVVGLSRSDIRRSRRWQRHNRNRLHMEFSRDAHVDFEMLSFQAQLALALMESQQMMQNGVNNGNNRQNEQTGVSEEKKQSWHLFDYSSEEDFHRLVQKKFKWKNSNTSSNSSSGSSSEHGKNSHVGYANDYDNDDEAPSCCICLCEYEEGDKMVQLPCGHIFHADCINSWTQSHSTCPLCNLELEGSNNYCGEAS